MNLGVQSLGIKLPIIREGDNLEQIILDTIDPSIISDNDIIGITESAVARAQGNYVTVDELAEEIKAVMHNPDIITIANCIYSRNRFAIILKAVARAAGKRVRIYMPTYDEVGNVAICHPFTKVDYRAYYSSIVEDEGKECVVFPWEYRFDNRDTDTIYCGLHNYDSIKRGFGNLFILPDFFKDKCQFGLLGCNKATETKIKLFPNTDKAKELCSNIKSRIHARTGKDVIVCVYGDGCFKDPIGGIWEFADPVTMPAYTDEPLMESSPNEVKLKAVIDEGATDADVKKIIDEKAVDLRGNMISQGTTPRRYMDLLASLMDLTSGSGDKGTPVVLIKNYFSNYVK